MQIKGDGSLRNCCMLARAASAMQTSKDWTGQTVLSRVWSSEIRRVAIYSYLLTLGQSLASTGAVDSLDRDKRLWEGRTEVFRRLI